MNNINEYQNKDTYRFSEKIFKEKLKSKKIDQLTYNDVFENKRSTLLIGEIAIKALDKVVEGIDFILERLKDLNDLFNFTIIAVSTLVILISPIVGLSLLILNIIHATLEVSRECLRNKQYETHFSSYFAKEETSKEELFSQLQFLKENYFSISNEETQSIYKTIEDSSNSSLDEKTTAKREATAALLDLKFQKLAKRVSLRIAEKLRREIPASIEDLNQKNPSIGEITRAKKIFKDITTHAKTENFLNKLSMGVIAAMIITLVVAASIFSSGFFPIALGTASFITAIARMGAKSRWVYKKIKPFFAPQVNTHSSQQKQVSIA